MFLFAEEPVEQMWCGEGLVPAEMTQMGVVYVVHVFASEFFQGQIHLAAADRFHQFVLVAMEDVEWSVFDSFGIGGIAPSADGYGSGKSTRIALQSIPNAKSAHRDANDVNLVGVDVARCGQAVNELFDSSHLSGGVCLHTVRQQFPIGIDPSLLFRTLGQQQQVGILTADAVVDKLSDAMSQLLLVVVASLTGTVKENHQSRGVARGCCALRFVYQIGEGVVVVNVTVPFE